MSFICPYGAVICRNQHWKGNQEYNYVLTSDLHTIKNMPFLTKFFHDSDIPLKKISPSSELATKRKIGAGQKHADNFAATSGESGPLTM